MSTGVTLPLYRKRPNKTNSTSTVKCTGKPQPRARKRDSGALNARPGAPDRGRSRGRSRSAPARAARPEPEPRAGAGARRLVTLARHVTCLPAGRRDFLLGEFCTLFVAKTNPINKAFAFM